MYPKKTPKQTKDAEKTKKLIAQQQREQLKTLIAQRSQSKVSIKHAQSLIENVEALAERPQRLNSERLQALDINFSKSATHKNEIAQFERDDVSVKSGGSRMSGATDFAISDRGNDAQRESRVLDIMVTRKKGNTKAYRNEEEEWADIYKYNQTVFQAEAQLTKDRKKFEKVKFKHELDELVAQKNERKQREVIEKGIDYEQVLLSVNRELKKEQKKADIEKAKVAFQKEMRDKQIQEIKAQRRQETKEEKQLDAYIIKRIREEQQEDERVAKRRKQEEQASFKRILKENEEKRQRLLEENARERREEIRLIKEQCRLIEERERARDEESKAKDLRIRNQIEMAKQLIGKPSDERERRQEEKVRKWASRKEQEEEEEALKVEHLHQQRRMDNKAYLDKQTQEKVLRKAQDKEGRNEQAKIWKNSSEKFLEYEKQKEETRKQEMKVYASVLKKQMQEKFDERRITDKLFDLRVSMYESKSAKAI